MIMVKVGNGKDLHVDAIADNILRNRGAGTPLILVRSGGDDQRGG